MDVCLLVGPPKRDIYGSGQCTHLRHMHAFLLVPHLSKSLPVLVPLFKRIDVLH